MEEKFKALRNKAQMLGNEGNTLRNKGKAPNE